MNPTHQPAVTGIKASTAAAIESLNAANTALVDAKRRVNHLRRQTLQTILPGLTHLALDSEWETGDEGQAFLTYGAITLRLAQGREVEIPHSDNIDNGNWPECDPYLSDEMQAAVDAVCATENASNMDVALGLLARELGITTEELGIVIQEASSLLDANYSNPAIDLSPTTEPSACN